ncbi:MAG: alkyl hydroperoxide reductase/Thiol specific antioxidant/Mal allergen [Acidobacteriales bacterium]|nr:alkyl hydroperoxide reductase/Thiol specific antioxidant/Mal allergen [Terriglobales bacterium]
MPAYNADLAKFAGFDAQVVGVSVDSIPSHIAWQKSIGTLAYPLASDFYPHGKTAQDYGVLREGDPIPGINERAVFVVDKEGKIAFAQVYELGEQPDNEDVFDVLRKL